MLTLAGRLRSAAKTCEEVDANLMCEAADKLDSLVGLQAHCDYLERVHQDAVTSLESVTNSLRATS